MKLRYLLDTDALSDLVRNPQGRVATRVAQAGEQSVATSMISAAELRYGVAKKASARLIRQVDAVLAAVEVLPLESPVDQRYAAIRCALEAAGTPIGANDMLIASQALALNLVLVTGNEREFRRVSELRIENWMK